VIGLVRAIRAMVTAAHEMAERLDTEEGQAEYAKAYPPASTVDSTADSR
jgi:hypothetical protein